MIDLHTHTNFSDGDLSSFELIDLAKKRGIDTISITDHDTINAYKSDIIAYAKKLGILLIPGIEFSTIDGVSNVKIHVTGLNFNINDENLNLICDKLNLSRRNMIKKIEEKLKPFGIILRSQLLLDSNAIITKSHIGKDVIDNPDNLQVLKSIYGKVPLQGTFIEDYLIKGKPAFVKNEETLTTEKAVEIIKQAGGKAFCSHPSSSVLQGLSFDDIKKLIIRNKFDGLEAINIQYDKSNNDKRFDMVREFSDFASNNNLLISGGSDYHSDNFELWGNCSALGLANEGYQIDNIIVEKILQNN